MTRVREELKKRLRRQRRVRAVVKGTSWRPRLSVFRSGRHMSVQLIDDVAGVTLASVSDRELPRRRGAKPASRRDRARWVGEQIATRARSKGISAARFERGPYRYHGLVAAVAEGARAAGLTL